MIVSAGYRKKGFDAFGGKVLRKGDMSHWMNDPNRTDPNGVALGLGDEVTEVKRDFFRLLPTVSSIWMENPECKINMSKKNEKLFLKNNVIIRGRYDTSAEAFARRYHLRFLHLDVKLASVGDYFEHLIYHLGAILDITIMNGVRLGVRDIFGKYVRKNLKRLWA